MKLILQIAAGVVLGGLVMMGIHAIAAYSTLNAIATALPKKTVHVPPISATGPTLQPRDYTAPPYAGPMTKEQQDAYIRADQARAQSDHDAKFGVEQPAKVEMIRKATPQDALAKPADSPTPH
jgi:hypothetical protein